MTEWKSGDRVPGWDEPRATFPPTGPRRTQDDIAVCNECGQDISEPPVYLDGRLFCSRACMDASVRR